MIAALHGGTHARTQQQRPDFGFCQMGRSSGSLASVPWPFSTPDRSIIWGDARAIAFGRSKGVLSLESWLHFRQGSRLDRWIIWGKARADAVGRFKANSRLNFGYILARSRDLASAPWPFSAPDRCSIWENVRADVLGRCISVLSRTSG